MLNKKAESTLCGLRPFFNCQMVKLSNRTRFSAFTKRSD